MGPTGPTQTTSGWSSGGRSFMRFISELGTGRFSVFCRSVARRCRFGGNRNGSARSIESDTLARRLSSVTRVSRSNFIDPRTALEKEFEAARGQLRQARGPSRSLLGALRLFMAERRLHYEMVTKP